jgi:hypothetical protein
MNAGLQRRTAARPSAGVASRRAVNNGEPIIGAPNYVSSIEITRNR